MKKRGRRRGETKKRWGCWGRAEKQKIERKRKIKEEVDMRRREEREREVRNEMR